MEARSLLDERNPPCPTCGCTRTRTIKGRDRYGATHFQQRYQCENEDCRQKFLYWWTAEFLRTY